MNPPGIAIVGVACRYPDARTPLELWDNVFAGRRAFRRIPPERLPLSDYSSIDRQAPDLTYGTWAAVLEGYRFDRVRYRVSADTFDTVDLAHWLALDVASDALVDAGFDGGTGLPRATTSVLVGNTLTGEFSRAWSLRLRWPYVRRVVDAALEGGGESAAHRAGLLLQMETAFKAPFPPVNGETLAGSLSNTIAGRICNYFDLKGGGYTVDGACASSLLAVGHACSALTARDVDVALAGGVDLSLDPFELVGFAKAGALASDDMRVYDVSPTGFWPGEGCGFAVLMREDDARAQRRRVYAVIRGWGISSDGSGGMTRPELDGQMLAIDRAYARAPFGVDTVAYFEGHGTGTAVGDATELAAIAGARKRCGATPSPAAIGSIKANIGHTKAAAGIAGLLKATMAVHARVLPPMTGCRQPHALLADPGSSLRPLDEPEPWPKGMPPRAGVSAMGFGGINAHVAIEGVGGAGRTRASRVSQARRGWQDAELILVSGRDASDLTRRLDELIHASTAMSVAELTDLAVHLQCAELEGPARAALVASSPLELGALLRRALDVARSARPSLLDPGAGVCVGMATQLPRIAFLFTGQGAPLRTTGGLWSRRFPEVRSVYEHARLPHPQAAGDMAMAQPAIVAASLAGARVLERCGVRADVGIGHSLGEISALAWAECLSYESALELARTRGELMAGLAQGPGAMAAIAGSLEVARSLIADSSLVVAALNARNQVVVSGHQKEIDALLERAAASGVRASRLAVAHAFHSPLMANVVPALRDALRAISFGRVRRSVVSTVTGALIVHDDMRDLLVRQLYEPVRFADAMDAAGPVDLFVEVGPGQSLSALASMCGAAQAVAVDASGASLRPLLAAIGAAYSMGARIDAPRLAAERYAKPIDLTRRREFLANPCELAPRAERPAPSARPATAVEGALRRPETSPEPLPRETCTLLRALVARKTELPIEAVAAGSRFLSDLHLNSITVTELLQDVTNRMGLPPFVSPTDFADATLSEAAQALDALARAGAAAPAADAGSPPGLGSWVRAFVVRQEETPLRGDAEARRLGPWQVVSSPGHPLRGRLLSAFADGAGGPGIVVCLDPGPDPAVMPLLDAARGAIRERRASRFVVVQQEGGVSSFARTLSLEAPHLDVACVTVPFTESWAGDRVHREARAVRGFVEASYDTNGQRLIPVLDHWPLGVPAGSVPLGPDDVLLVTGGGKGIAAECGLALARDTGVQLALLGRSDPSTDPVLAANLARFRAGGARASYVTADVREAASVCEAVREIRAACGDVTAVLHAAGVNEPALIASLDEAAVAATLHTKVDGARHLLAALDPARLRMFITFGSLIARTGLAGEAHYAIANERLRRLTERVAVDLPRCVCMCIEWSVWAAAGMGERLGRVESLARYGVTPIEISRGVDMLKRLLAAPPPSTAVIVTSRSGPLFTERLAGQGLPFHRFLESPRIHYPGIELVADASISLSSDPYLADHRLDGEQVFPAVLGLEAMAQAAAALHGAAAVATAHDVEFVRPIVIPVDGSLVLRVVALAESRDRVNVALRAASTGFHVDHFRAAFHWPAECAGEAPAPLDVADSEPIAAVDPARDLYGTLLFHAGRFARVRAYRRLLATECCADISATATSWFGPYLPGTLLLGDAGARDAALHSIQACIPQRRLVPIAVSRIRFLRPLAGPCRVRARQRSEHADEFVWDIEVLDDTGAIAEIWEELRLRGIATLSVEGVRAPLLGPYVERRLPDLGHGIRPRVLVTERGGRTADTMAGLLQSPAMHRRPDGKPELSNGEAVSVAHAGELTLAVTARSAVGCDLEPVRNRTIEMWRDLLGADRSSLAEFIAESRHEALAHGATRVWAAIESLKKAGAPPDAPLMLERAFTDGWVTLRAGTYAVSTWIAAAADHGPVAMAVVTGEGDAGV